MAPASRSPGKIWRSIGGVPETEAADKAQPCSTTAVLEGLGLSMRFAAGAWDRLAMMQCG